MVLSPVWLLLDILIVFIWTWWRTNMIIDKLNELGDKHNSLNERVKRHHAPASTAVLV